MKTHEKFIKKCLDLAILGFKNTKTNPLVGCVIVHKNNIISSGYHKKYGSPHAEKNAIENLKNTHPDSYKALLQEATLYVNLEPCSHYGKTPPCVNLIIEYKIKKVVIGTMDPCKKVNGKGIKKLQKHTKVIVGVLSNECYRINKAYFTNQTLNRPLIILKWAESKDGFVNTNSIGITKISSKKSIILSHEWRSKVDAIMVGTNTIICDNPKLTTRHVIGENPIRITIDRNDRLHAGKWNILNSDAQTIILNETKNEKKKHIEYLNYRKNNHLKNISDQQKLRDIMKTLYVHKITSILVEGGPTILNSMLKNNLWDEARIFVSKKLIESGVKGPLKKYLNEPKEKKIVGEDVLLLIQNSQNGHSK